MHRNFLYGQLSASAIFVFISMPFQKLFVYLDFTLSYRKFYSQVKQPELESQIRNNTSFLISYFPFLQSPYFSFAESSFI